jgi:hypothetical protein
LELKGKDRNLKEKPKNMTKISLLLCLLILLAGCEEKGESSGLTVICPDELRIETVESVIFSASVDFPLPTIQTDCSSPEWTYTLDIATVLTAGTHTGVFNVTDACGNRASCSIVVNVIENPSALTIDCPYIFNLDMETPEIATSDINLPIHDFANSSCILGGLEYFFNPETFGPGIHFANCYISDSCGNSKTCLVKLTLLYDYRNRFLGKYQGYRKCEHYAAGTITYDSAELIILTVIKAPQPDRVLIVEDDDYVRIDSNGNLPSGTAVSGYRFYNLQFRKDSLHLLYNKGVVNYNTTCSFNGTKIE